MKILAIRGRNLASLAADFEVDFRKEPLASAGLYAICGPTGSGKSTLLDTLSVALYDKTPRLAKASVRGVGLPDVADATIAPHDPRTLLRRSASEGYAEVDFVGNDNLGYRARWSVRRSRGKAVGKLQNVEMSLIKVADQQPIGHSKTEVLEAIESRLGLTFEQFTRAILLAQNEFFVFLKADDNDRAELLETLTGTDTYTGISRRAFERAKTEAEVLARLRQKLEDQKPLELETRRQLELENKNAVATSLEMEKDKTVREKHLAWYAALEQLKNEEQQAHKDAEAALNEKKAAEPRRIDFVRIEHVQNAKPLVVELDRIIADVNNGKKHVNITQQQLDVANKAHQEAHSNLKKAEQAVAEAEQARNNATEDLAKARSLDTRITTLQPLVDQAEKELQTAQAVEEVAKTELAAKQDVLKTATQRLKGLSEWLEINEKLRPLAERWPKWDTLFDQAGEMLIELNKATKALATAKEGERSKATAARDATAVLEKAAAALKAAETQHGALDKDLASYDVQAMVAERKNVDGRRDQLSSAETVWQGLAGKQSRMAEIERKAEERKREIIVAETALEEALQQKPEYEAALKQAERSLERAQLACTENVEDMRSALVDEAPCPVCGSTNHPYVTDDPRYRSILSGLQLDVEECRKKMAAVETQETSNRTLVQTGRELLSSYEKELRDLASAIQVDNAAWIAFSVAAELVGVETTIYLKWFEEQKTIISNRLALVDIKEEAYRAAVKARDKAQVNLNNIRGHYLAVQQADSAAKTAMAQAIAATGVAVEKAENDAGRLDAELADLNTVMSEHGWRETWKSDPKGFHRRQKEQAELWSKNGWESEQLKIDISKLQIQITELNSVYDKAGKALNKQKNAYQNINRELSTSIMERQTFFAGRRADDVEAAFIQTIEIAKRKREEQNEFSQKTLAEQARALEAYSQAGKNLQEREGQMREAEKVLDAWITEYNSINGDKDVLSMDRLRELVVYDGVWIANEREELRKLDDAIERTKAVLKERKDKRERHEQERPTNDTLEVIQAALESLITHLDETKTRATALTVELRQDDECIARSAEVLAEIQTQADKERIWAQLSELIGAADGKKFRNYAQQFTLDVLIGYANRHLIDLSRRYRLERVKETLSLLIVDQDMGDERRSVHSLSGGESFLVSLALALGLASLSSNRIRVESLFIDEGFGSLDPETLLVAMDALDNLQSQGRKVGVISHLQEMTERIGTQIQVKRVSGGESRISVVTV